MSNYKEFGIKLLIIVLAEMTFFLFMPNLSNFLGAEPYHFVTLVTGGAVVAYAVNSCFESVKKARSAVMQKHELDRLRAKLNALALDVEVLKDEMNARDTGQ